MHGREMTRIMIEGALNGIGFVIGSAVVGWIFLHGSAVLAFAVLVIVLWLIFRNGRHLKTRLERAKIDEFTRALRSSAINAQGISSQGPEVHRNQIARLELRKYQGPVSLSGGSAEVLPPDASPDFRRRPVWIA